MNELDFKYTKDVKCPHCKYEHSDSWELIGGQDEEIEHDCDNCGKKFFYVTDYDITFCSYKKKEAE